MALTRTEPAAAGTTPVKGTGIIMLGLMLGILLAALDQTVVGTSLPKIVADIGGMEYYTWLFAAYMLASTVVIPVAGKLSDLFGARPVLLVGMSVFLLGSALCGLAGHAESFLGMDGMTQLIVARAIQGLGGGVIFPVALATIADLYPPAERAKVGGMFGATFGLSSVIGPFLGGWIVDNVHLFDVASWRWVFYVNLPVGIPALLIVATKFPRLARKGTARIDYLGMATLAASLVALLLATVWGGETYAWASPQILGLIALSLGMAALFVYLEGRVEDPIIPLKLFREPIFRVSVLASFLMGAGMFGVISFMPLFMQGVIGVSATYSGAVLTPLTLMLVAGSIVSGRFMNKLGYKVFTLIGCAIAAVGFILLSTLTKDSGTALAVAFMLVVGLGLGFTIQTYVVAVQNVVPRRETGVATSTVTLFRSLGAALGVAALGVVLNERLARELPERVPAEALTGVLANEHIAGHLSRVPQLLLEPGFVASAPPFLVEGIKDAFTASMSVVYVVTACVAATALIASFFLKNLPLRGREEQKAAEGEAEATPVLTH